MSDYKGIFGSKSPRLQYYLERKSHPGWKSGGTVTRAGQNHKFHLVDNGIYEYKDKHWVFKATVDGSEGYWYILPIAGDIYQPKETNMITRNWIVVSNANGPSYVPKTHATKKIAISEAKRLVLLHPLDKFFVYELCNAFEVETVKEIEIEEPFPQIIRKGEDT